MRRRGAIIAAGVAGFVFLVLVAGAIALQLTQRDKVYQNVFVNNLNLGGMTRTEAQAALAGMLAPTLTKPVMLTSDNKQWTPLLADLGVRPDVNATVADAFAVGRGGGPLAQWWSIIEMRLGGRQHVPITVSVNRGVMDTYLDTLQVQLGTPPVNATLKVQGSDLIVTPGTNGIKLDREKVQGQLLDDVANLRSTAVTLPVAFSTPTMTTAQAEAAKMQAEMLVGMPLALSFNDKQWVLNRDDLLRTLRIGDAFALSVDTTPLKSRVDAIAAEVKQDPLDAEIGWDNALVVRKASKNGQKLDVAKTMSLLAAWKGDTRTIALPVEVAKPRIPDDVSTLGITTRVGRGVSNFAGSDSARAKNIAVAAGYLDNTIVGPGETFSFLDSIGEISAARGYKDGYVILAEETVPGIGGGVCQVATTMFRAAVFSGLPIEERNPHAYLVRYYEQGGYPVGLDAAVFSPGVDLKFRNDSDKYLLIKTGIDGAANLYVSIYGPELNYKVDLTDPVITNKKSAPDDEYQVDPMLPPGSKKQVEFAKSGEDVAITRTVMDKDGAVLRKVAFTTHYQAWPNKFLVSKDMAGGKPAQATTAPNKPSVTSVPTKAPAASVAVQPTATLPKPQNTPVPTPVAVKPAPTTKP